uniref:Ribonuclease A-domain domain-containing protein n=1 Tax=Salvator merianae TaxID=96440 RepID=A0A8D0B2K1_SALMN
MYITCQTLSFDTTATMVPKDTYRLFLYLTILLGVLLMQSCEGQNWGAFRNKHIDYPKTEAPNVNAYCNLMIQQRGLNEGKCKPTNTFINESPSTVQQVCTKTSNGYRISADKFPVVECRNRGRWPDCNYVGKPRTGQLRLLCRDNLPIHYGGLA